MIGWYAHHQGGGHLARMRCVVARTTLPVTVLSSAPPGAGDGMPWEWLAHDDQPAPGPDADVTAHGRLHWVPRHHSGLVRRSAHVAAWIERARPRLLVVDVSVEVATLARLCGVPVVLGAMPGRRDDPAHLLAHDLADALLVPWPEDARTDWPDSWRDKAVFLGGVSRFDGRDLPAPRPAGPRPRGLLVWGSGGGGLGAEVIASLRTGTPGWDWEVAGLEGRHLDGEQTWQALADADVVVTHAGQGSVAEVAAARRPAVVLADERPFDEQRCTVRRLADAGLAATAVGCPEPGAWPGLLDEALATDPAHWSAWSTGDGADRAARALERLAGDPV